MKPVLVDIIEWVEEGERDIASMSQELATVSALEVTLESAQAARQSLLAHRVWWERADTAAKLAKGYQTDIAAVDKRIAEIDGYAAPLRDMLASINRQLADAEAMLAETVAIGRLKRLWRGLPPPRSQEAAIRKLTTKRKSLQEKTNAADEVLAELRAKRAVPASAVAAFCNEYQGSPPEVLGRRDVWLAQIADAERRIEVLLRDHRRIRTALDELLAQRLAALREMELTEAQPADATSILDAVRHAHETARLQVAGQDLSVLTRQLDELNSSVSALNAECQRIEESLRRVEELVIADACVVATTLTRAYLRDSIQSRRFDTLIVDEASMAPIPAIWVAASTATSNAVVVGDFQQLPPIVISKHDMSLKWLGHDVFDVSGLGKPEDPTGRRVDLVKQHRMHPQISAIPNTLVYQNKLIDAAGMDREGEKALAEWYRPDWGHDHPVLLVDTGSVGAWVTSVARGSRASRLNFLSATICVDLAAQLLKEDREALGSGERPRILIACPYRPHAKLLELLIREEGLAGDSKAGKAADVAAGTAHSFQGSEADVVILDLVNDEPHFRVGMFDAKRNLEIRKLMNVALTRAKRRLVVVGDFAYIQKTANKEAFLRRDFLPFLLSRYPRVDARDVVPVGLAARAARAQSRITGGPVEANADRLVVTQERFYPVLQDDLGKAKQRVVVYSAFITQDRLGQLAPQFRAAVERGVRVYVVTKAKTDRIRAEVANYQRLERTLADWGITVIHKQRMHEKLIFIDDEIIWVGSLNPLSFSSTQEIMERRRSSKVAADYAQTVMLAELLAAYGEGLPSCPICGNEVVASEGVETPFYWKCVEEDCYSRSVDQPPLTDGLIVCANAQCGGPVAYGEWGGEPVWRCELNPRHHQRIARTHLRLPKMRDLIPKRDLKRLEEMFGKPKALWKKMKQDREPPTLFDLWVEPD